MNEADLEERKLKVDTKSHIKNLKKYSVLTPAAWEQWVKEYVIATYVIFSLSIEQYHFGLITFIGSKYSVAWYDEWVLNCVCARLLADLLLNYVQPGRRAFLNAAKINIGNLYIGPPYVAFSLANNSINGYKALDY
jgi:hypothetical protein